MLEEPWNILTMSSPLDEQAMSQLQSQQSELLDKIVELRVIGVGGLSWNCLKLSSVVISLVEKAQYWRQSPEYAFQRSFKHGIQRRCT